MKIRNDASHDVAWLVYNARSGLDLIPFADGRVLPRDSVSWYDSTFPTLKLRLRRVGTLDDLFDAVVPASTELRIGADFSVRPVPEGSIDGQGSPHVTVRNRSRTPVHVALSWNGILQQTKNDLAAGSQHLFDSPSGPGLYDVTIARGTPERRWDTTATNTRRAADVVFSIPTGLTSIPATVYSFAMATQLDNETITSFDSLKTYDITVTGGDAVRAGETGPIAGYQPLTVAVTQQPEGQRSRSIIYLGGQMIQALGQNEVYRIHGGRRYHVTTEEMVTALGGRPVVHRVTPAEVAGYPLAPQPATFEGKMFRIPVPSTSGSARGIRWIHLDRAFGVNPALVDLLGGKRCVYDVSAEWLRRFPDAGQPATDDCKLFEVPGEGKIWWTRNGPRHHVRDESTLEVLGGRESVQIVSSATRDAFPEADVPASVERRLIQAAGDPTVWWLGNGQRRRVPDDETMRFLGGLEHVARVSAATRDRFVEGVPIPSRRRPPPPPPPPDRWRWRWGRH